MNARKYLELANRGQMNPEQLMDALVVELPKLMILYQKSDAGKKPFLSKGSQPTEKFVVVCSDLDAARTIQVSHPQMVELVEEPALPFLIKAYRSDATGILMNPGLPSCLFMVKSQLLKLIREYAVHKLSQLPGPWIPTMNQNLLLVEHQKGNYTVAVYSDIEDAEYVSKKSGGTVIQHPWSVVFERCYQLKAPAPYLHFGLPEKCHLLPKHMQKIQHGPHAGYVESQHVAHPFVMNEKQPELEKIESVLEQSPQLDDKKDEKQGSKVLQEQVMKPTISENEGQPSTGQANESIKQESPVLVKEEKPHIPIVGKEGIIIQKPSQEAPKSSPPIQKEKPQPKLEPSPAVQKPIQRKPIDPAVKLGLEKLEKATVEGQGLANGWEVCRAMAELRRIWVVVDPEGNMVILAGQDQSPIVDFFTSERHAQILIDEAHRKNSQLPSMIPRLVSTKKLYRALAPRHPIVWINRGSTEAWTSIMGDTLPYVLQLMSQLEKEKN
ncbi:hypothetical protein [Hazenella coriacea]|uniref:Uncharacterized protein n=1 Tax=Hazenella coriacea TaxID=1179467 RepID=A0A4R3L7I5_9BACL|nr:hypothetical protein [Hazenella coriacea]TCS95068.1 hypothetical protein EDD58_103494 [Hazenella coriacea]